MRRPLRASRWPLALLALALMVAVLATGLHYTRAAFMDKETVSASFQAGVWDIATVDLKPESLQKKSQGEPVTAFIELPQGYDVRHINVDSLRLCLGTARCSNGVPANRDAKIGDSDKDGIPDLKVTFSREGVVRLVRDIPPPATVTFSVWGLVGSELFSGSDTVRLVDPEKEPKEKEPTPTAPASTPTATATVTAVPRLSPSATATLTATPTATATQTTKATATPTRTVTPTATLPPAQASSPTPTTTPKPR